MELVKNKVVIITGSTDGIGYAIAKLFGKEGAKVVVTGRRVDKCQTVADEIVREGGIALGIPCDVTDPVSLETMFDKTVEFFGEVNVLVNNVACGFSEPFLEASREHVSRIFETCVGATYFGSQRAAKEMIKQGKGGKIIHIASTAGLYGERGNSGYCAAKAAVMNLAKTMALELGEYHINVNAVAPGTTVTRNEKRSEQVLEGFRIMSALPRLNRAEDIAPAVVFLASDKAAGITGQTLPVDAGFSSVMMPEKLFAKC